MPTEEILETAVAIGPAAGDHPAAPLSLHVTAPPRASTSQVADSVRSVMITCPQTGEAVETVLRLRVSAFEALHGEYSFRCTRCGQVHQWAKEHAWLKGAPAPGGQSKPAA